MKVLPCKKSLTSLIASLILSQFDSIASLVVPCLNFATSYLAPLSSTVRHVFKIKSLEKIDLLVSDIIREPTWERSGPSYNVKEFDYIKSILKFPKKKIIQINHHLAHAASVYYTSGFNNSAILIVDGNGTDLETNSFF